MRIGWIGMAPVWQSVEFQGKHLTRAPSKLWWMVWQWSILALQLDQIDEIAKNAEKC